MEGSDPNIPPYFQWLRDDLDRISERISEGNKDLKDTIRANRTDTEKDMDEVKKRVEQLEKFRLFSSITIAVMMVGIANNSTWLPTLMNAL